MLHPNENSSDFLSSFYTLNNLILCFSPKICLIIHLKNEYKQDSLNTTYLNKRCIHVGGVLMTIKRNTHLPLSAMKS